MYAMLPPDEALARLRAGNQRFVSGACRLRELASPAARRELLTAQHPFAIVLGCSDSRVPVELVFDEGPGALFVVRIAGNIAAPSQVASVEFAVDRLGTRLVVVLGHTGCGAVAATLDALERPDQPASHPWRSITEYIRPAVEGLLSSDVVQDRDALLRAAIRANVRASTDALQRGSPTLARLVASRYVSIVGAVYALETGVVEFLSDAAKP